MITNKENINTIFDEKFRPTKFEANQDGDCCTLDALNSIHLSVESGGAGDVLIAALLGILGPLSFILGWSLHSDKAKQPLIKRRK